MGLIKVVPKREYEFSTGEDFEALLANSNALGKGENCIVDGVVQSVDSRYVIMDVGMKNYGRVYVDEFRISGEYESLTPGNKFEVFVETLEDPNGYVALSREKALKYILWPLFTKAKVDNETLEGIVCGKIKGGLVVNIMGVLAFLPGSQVGVKPMRDFSALMGENYTFHVLSLDDVTKNVVVSRKSVFEASRLSIQDEALNHIHEGQVLEGCVKNLTKYGAFVDLGEFDGLLHLTDMSWRRIAHPSELLSVGQKIKVQVIKVNRAARRVSLGMKQLSNNPWSDISQQYKVGDRIIGHVTNTTDYGVFVEIKPGIEGLVYVSEVSWIKSPGNGHLNVAYKKGQEVEVVVLGIEPEKNRISLSIKQCEDNPWVKFAEKYKVGDIVEGTVNNVADFGAFVTLDGKVDGLVHVSDISWGGDHNVALATMSRKQQVRAKILSIDVKKGRVGLGVKQVERDPLEAFLKNIKINDVMPYKIISVNNDGLTVSPVQDRDVVISVDIGNLGTGGSAQYSVDDVLDLVASDVRSDLRLVTLTKK